jgi:ribonuclease HII
MNMLVGIDEVGRGSWAGPLVAAAVLLDNPIDGLTDSKLITSKKRIVLSNQILMSAKDYGIGWVSAEEIDAIGLTKSVSLAMERAISKIKNNYEKIIIDGNYNYLKDYKNVETLIKADLLIPSVSAASIIAKVARDNYMKEKSLDYPGFGFDKNVGYGTKQHLEALNKYGLTDIHRKSFKPMSSIF